MIDQVTAQKIKDAADIVEVVSDYVHLVRRGANYMGLCPFHNERTPSFSVSKRKNFCFCFSCKKGGSPVNFIMEKEGLSYHDALLHLARKYGIEVKERELTDEERAAQSERESMLVANEWAMGKMESDMHDTEEGRDIGLQYLYQRGVTEEAARKFRLGYALDKGSALVNASKAAGYDPEVLKKLGLIGTSSDGRLYDRFRGRVIFPIINSAGKVVAFGGRDLKGSPAKYINSPESSLYKKSNELYGIYQARADIVKEDKCYLVEGYLDVIGMWQSGMRNTVASSGTALTDGQIALIHRFTENITLIYDGDAAGIKASLRGIDMLLNHKMKVKVLLLPDGDDPDSFARKHTPEEFRQYVAEHETDIIRFKAQVLLSDIQKDPQKRIEAVNSVVESLAHIPDAVARDVYIQECSSILGISEDTVAKSVARVRGSLVEKWRREKARRDFPIDSPRQEPIASPAEENKDVSGAVAEIRRVPAGFISPSPLSALERKVIEYSLKYGFMDGDALKDEENDYYPEFVLDYICDELDSDNIVFSVDVFRKIFEILRSMRDDFRHSLEVHMQSIGKSLEEKRKEGIERIGREAVDMSQIEKEEKKLEEEINDIRLDAETEFSKNFASRILASHEEDDIRATVNELIRETHHLSHIYERNNDVDVREENRFPMLVMRSIVELKNELLNQKLKELITKFREISGKGDEEAERKLQMQISAIMRLRSQIAKDIGERILFPSKSSK